MTSLALLIEEATEDGIHAEHVEHAAARPEAIDRIDFPTLCQTEPFGFVGEGAVEQRGPVANGFPDGIAPPTRTVLLVRRAQQDETVSVSNGERPKHERIDDREHRCIRADPEREGQDRDARREWIGAKRAEGISQVGHGGPRGRTVWLHQCDNDRGDRVSPPPLSESVAFASS
jgi:hypothetical protein